MNAINKITNLKGFRTRKNHINVLSQ